MMIESDFYATDAGRKHFADQLTSIRCAAPKKPSPARCPRRRARLKASSAVQVLRAGDV